MKECTGIEICAEWLYHMGVPEEEILDMAANSASTIPCMMLYITAFVMLKIKLRVTLFYADYEHTTNI